MDYSFHPIGANRRIIVKIARQHLAIGGILYISYNSTPGWSAAMPLRHLINLHADMASGEALGVLSKVDGALAFAQSVVDSKAGYFKANPAVSKVQKGLIDIRPLMGLSDGAEISEKTVKEIHAIAEDLVKTIGEKIN